MKNVVIALCVLLFFGCAQDRVAKPNQLLTVDQMTRFHLDLALVNASSPYPKESIIPIDSLYAFHNIDSITFAQNNAYYASKPKVYVKIFEGVKSEIDRLQELDSLSKRESLLLKE